VLVIFPTPSDISHVTAAVEENAYVAFGKRLRLVGLIETVTGSVPPVVEPGFVGFAGTGPNVDEPPPQPKAVNSNTARMISIPMRAMIFIDISPL
jgi:hypothetical protein